MFLFYLRNNNILPAHAPGNTGATDMFYHRPEKSLDSGSFHSPSYNNMCYENENPSYGVGNYQCYPSMYIPQSLFYLPNDLCLNIKAIYDFLIFFQIASPTSRHTKFTIQNDACDFLLQPIEVIL
jgi:hypothetical protein